MASNTVALTAAENTIKSVEGTLAAASTTDLSTVTTHNVQITGSATIISFGSAINCLRYVRFTSAVTLTHNAALLVLPGATNITTAVGDTAVAASDSTGVWRVYVYQKADGTPLIPSGLSVLSSAQSLTAVQQQQVQTNIGVFLVPVRQTVLSGPLSSGVPSFLPSTTSGLSITTQNISSSSPLVITSAQGSPQTAPITGQINGLYTTTANLTFNGLTGSSTNFLFVNTTTTALTVSTLQPIYQFGGAISTANGQFSFDFQSMTGYLGNGTSAIASPLVCIGEAVTSSSAVTQTTAYAYQGKYQSGVTSWTYSARTLFAHNVGVNVEFLETTSFISNATNSNWMPNIQCYSSYAFNAVGLFGYSPRNQIAVYPGSGGYFYDNGSNPGNTLTSGYMQISVRRRY